jgi:hypothetical protein
MKPVAGCLAFSGGEAATGLRGQRLGPARAAGRHGAKVVILWQQKTNGSPEESQNLWGK